MLILVIDIPQTKAVLVVFLEIHSYVMNSVTSIVKQNSHVLVQSLFAGRYFIITKGKNLNKSL